MLLLEEVENRIFLQQLFGTMYDELPVSEKRKNRKEIDIDILQNENII